MHWLNLLKGKTYLLILIIAMLTPIVAFCALSLKDDVEPNPSSISVSFFPIAMYDSDIGLGLGAKTMVKNRLKKESLDLTLFGSTKGEQWYAFTFSHPDNESRQGVEYALALDTKIEYDKLVKSNYFGIGNLTDDNNFQFPREYFKFEQTLSHAFSPSLIAGFIIRLAHYSAYGYDTGWNTISKMTPGASENDMATAGATFRYDTRDSWINPKRGVKGEAIFEQSLKILGFDWKSHRSRLELSKYQRALGQNDIVAVRCWIQQIDGNCPYQELSKIGDGWTARGYKAERFLDKAMVLTSIEYRFPLYKKLGGVAFGDAGRVSPTIKELNLQHWHPDYGAGLRYYLANFVTRLDIGKSVEGMRIFFNFGHVF